MTVEEIPAATFEESYRVVCDCLHDLGPVQTLHSLSVVDVTRTEQETPVVTSQEPYESYTYGMGLCVAISVVSYSVGLCLVQTLDSLSVVDVTRTEQEIHIVTSQEPYESCRYGVGYG